MSKKNQIGVSGSFQEGSKNLVNISAGDLLNNSEQFDENRNNISYEKILFTCSSYGVVKKDTSEKRKELSNIIKGRTKISKKKLILHGKWKYKFKLETARKLNYDEDNVSGIFGESDNLLFYLNSHMINDYEEIRTLYGLIAFDISLIKDTNGNNLLHYAAYSGDLELLDIIVNKAESEVKLYKMINDRNSEGTNPLGIAFRWNPDSAHKLEIAKFFVSKDEYKIGDYLNNRYFMDYKNLMNIREKSPKKKKSKDYPPSEKIGGTNIFHNILFIASSLPEKSVKSLIDFFKILEKRLKEGDLNSNQYFNPYDATMNPGLITPKLDGHMINSEKLLRSLLKTSKSWNKIIKITCKKHLYKILEIYDSRHYHDKSGDSEDEASPSYKYKKNLIKFDNFIKRNNDEMDFETSTANVKFNRTFDKYKYDYANFPDEFQDFLENQGWFEFRKWNKYFNTPYREDLNLNELNIYQNRLNKCYIPLFHGVPFMQSQYTNFQRREVFNKLDELNDYLLQRAVVKEESKINHDPLNYLLASIHSRTALASVGMKNLYDLVTAPREKLLELNEIDESLQTLMSKSSGIKSFRTALSNYVFKFASSPIKNFWQNLADDIEDNKVVKYRFPLISTSKAPDHAIRFAIGRNVESNRGEKPLEPEYDKEGHPHHRLAGLLYVTLHPLKEYIRLISEKKILDVNIGLASKYIDDKNKVTVDRIKNQLEVSFFGKINNANIISIVPIIYPNLKKEEGKFAEESYLMDMYSIGSPGKKNIGSLDKIKNDLRDSPNPDFMDARKNFTGFGNIMNSSYVSLANGILTTVANKNSYFLCSVKDDNRLIPYQIGLNKAPQQNFSKAQQEIKDTDSEDGIKNVMWRKLLKNHFDDDNSSEPELSQISANYSEEEGLAAKLVGVHISD